MILQGSVIHVAARLADAESFQWIQHNQLLYQVGGVLVHGSRVWNIAFLNIIVPLKVIHTAPRRLTLNKLINDDTEGPQVRERAACRIIEHFWRDVEWRADKGSSMLSYLSRLFSDIFESWLGILLFNISQVLALQTFE